MPQVTSIDTLTIDTKNHKTTIDGIDATMWIANEPVTITTSGEYSLVNVALVVKTVNLI